MNIHVGFTLNGLKLQTIQVSINGQMTERSKAVEWNIIMLQEGMKY